MNPEAIEAARRILAANSPEAYAAIYGDGRRDRYYEDSDLVAAELLRLSELDERKAGEA